MPPATAPDAALQAQPFGRRHWWLIVIATVLAAGLRMLELGEWSLWIDEAHTWRDATMPFDGEDGFMASARRFYALPFLLLRFLFGIGVLGFGEWSVRLPFAVIGIATVPLLAICGRRLVGASPAVAAAWLLAINPWHLFWSQNARGYALVVLGSVLAIHRLHVLAASGRARDLLLSAAFVALAVMSHPPSATLVFGFVAFLMIGHAQRADSRMAWVNLALLAVFLVALPSLIRHYDLFSEFLDAKADLSPRHWFETVAYYFRPSLLLLALLAMLMAPRLLGRNRAMYLTCLVGVPMLAMTSVGSQLVKVTARYAICTLPPILWLVGMVLVECVRRVGQLPNLVCARAWLLAAVVPLLLVADFLYHDVAYFAEQNGQRARWREAAAFVRSEAEARGLRGLHVLSVNHPTMLYYLRPRHWFVGDHDPHPDVAVQAILSWEFVKGEDKDGVRLHDPGVAAYLQTNQRLADFRQQLFALIVTLPALREKDSEWPTPAENGQLEAALKRDYELALYLPTWVGPKDESIYVYLPKKSQ